MTTDSRKTRRTRKTASNTIKTHQTEDARMQRPSSPTPALGVQTLPAGPMPPPPIQAGVILPADVLAELRAGAELLNELLSKAMFAAQAQVVKRELDAVSRAAVNGAWAEKLTHESKQAEAAEVSRVADPNAPAPLRARGTSPPLVGQRGGGRKADLADPRLAGIKHLRRVFNDWTIEVDVRQDGFAWGGKVWPSLSAIARAVTGTRRNGYEFFELGEYAKDLSKHS
jgi:hypothetical protein